MVTNTSENGIDRKILKKEGVYKSGKMVPGMKANGRIIKPTDMGGLFMQRETSMKVTGRTIWQTARASTQASLETTILESGRTTRGINTVRKYGLTAPSMLANTKMELNMVLAKYLGMIRTHMRATLSIIILKGKDSIFGLIRGSTMEHGEIIKWKALVCSRGTTAGATGASSRMT